MDPNVLLAGLWPPRWHVSSCLPAQGLAECLRLGVGSEDRRCAQGSPVPPSVPPWLAALPWGEAGTQQPLAYREEDQEAA